MGIKFTNFATSTIANVGGIGAADVSLDVQPGDGALFPTLGAGDYFYAVLVSSGGTREIVKVTARSTDTFTIDRAEEGTSAAVFAAGSVVELRLTAGSFDALVKTTDTQTLTNKTLTSPVINTPTITSPTITSPVLNTGVSGTAVLDEDDMASDSAIKLATQQSIKAYVDAQIAAQFANTSFAAGGDLTGTFYIARSGKNVVMRWGSLTHVSGYSVSSGAGVVPAAYRPAATVYSVYNSGIVKRVSITSAGTVNFYYRGYDGVALADNETEAGTVSWPIA